MANKDKYNHYEDMDKEEEEDNDNHKEDLLLARLQARDLCLQLMHVQDTTAYSPIMTAAITPMEAYDERNDLHGHFPQLFSFKALLPNDLENSLTGCCIGHSTDTSVPLATIPPCSGTNPHHQEPPVPTELISNSHPYNQRKR